MSRNIEIPEILAPVGSVEAFYSAIYNGCDAVYLGGHNFGARAFANNFSEDELKDLVDYAHIFNVQVYYTLNTIVKDIEIKTLQTELELLRQVNIDAVIIQDIGVYKYIKDNFSDLVIHASTQMNLHSVKDIEIVKMLGFDRVVLSRECSLEDIRKIKDATGIEIEAFVHGALCYCYSGQCLMSSMYGGRSGNRGKCAQPCRMPYEVDGEAGYFLSPKDQMTLEILPDLIKAGVDSFKIEGRMKSAEYVGFATKIYKKYRDLSIELLKNGNEANYKVNPKDIQKLNQLFNRGHFTEGYYKQHNDKTMISYTHGKNQGLCVGVVTNENNQFTFKLTHDISKEDLLEIHSDINLKAGETWPAFSFNDNVKKGVFKTKQLYDAKRQKLNISKFASKKKYQVYRIRDKNLLEELKTFATSKKQLPISLKIYAYVNKPLRVEVYIDGASEVLVSLKGKLVDKALKRATVEADFIKQMSKTKDTAFNVENIECQLGDDIFMPISSINELRRETITVLEKKLLSRYNDLMATNQNTLKDNEFIYTSPVYTDDYTSEVKTKGQNNKYTISVRTIDQMNGVIQIIKENKSVFNKTKRVYLDITDLQVSDINYACDQMKDVKDVDLYLALPHVIFEEYDTHLKNKLANINTKAYDGLLIRTLGQITIATEQGKPFVTDYNLHTLNSYGLSQFSELGATAVTLSMELNKQGLKEIISSNGSICETVVYGSTSLMHSANCVYKTRTGKCDKKNDGHLLELEDRKGVSHDVQCHCNMCYNTIYNKHPLLINDEASNFKGSLRLDFTTEEMKATKNIISSIYDKSIQFNQDLHTRGHFKKGVK